MAISGNSADGQFGPTGSAELSSNDQIELSAKGAARAAEPRIYPPGAPPVSAAIALGKRLTF